MRKFKDISIFQNIVEFFTGEKMIRAMYRGNHIYDIYVGNGIDYIMSGSVMTKCKSPRGIYNAYLNA